MTGKEALETLGNVEVAVTAIKSGIPHFKTLKQQFETEFEVLERELFIKKELKNFDVYQKQFEQLEKKYQELEERYKKRAELCSEFAEYTRQYEKVLDFLMDKFKLELKGNRLYFLYNNQYFELDKEQEKLMKEAFGYE